MGCEFGKGYSLTTEQLANGVVLRKVECDGADVLCAQPFCGGARHIGCAGPEFGGLMRFYFVPPRFHDDDVSRPYVLSGGANLFFGDRRFRRDAREIDDCGLSYGLFQFGVAGCGSFRVHVARRIDVCESVDSPSHVGHLRHVAGFKTAFEAALNGPAEVVGNGHGEVDDGHVYMFPRVSSRAMICNAASCGVVSTVCMTSSGFSGGS